MMRRNPHSLFDEAKYFQSVLINEMAGFPTDLSTRNSHEQQRLMGFLERVINTMASPPVASPHKVYSPTGTDPHTLPTKPKALTPPRSIEQALSSESRLNQLERRARIGEPQAILDYLRVLDYQGHLSLDDLWVIPCLNDPHDIQRKEDLFSQPFPYTLGLTLAGIEKFNEKYHIYVDSPIKKAFVVDIGSLELGDIIEYELSNYLSGKLDAYDEAQLFAASTKYFILQAEAILILDKDGFHFPQAHEVPIVASRLRDSKQYWQMLHRSKHPGVLIRSSGPVQTHWPERRIKQLSIAQFPERSHNSPYVIIVHIPTQKAFAVSGGYGLIDDDVDQDTILHAMRYNRQTWQGWLPSDPSQRSEWVNQLLNRGESQDNFIAFWIAE